MSIGRRQRGQIQKPRDSVAVQRCKFVGPARETDRYNRRIAEHLVAFPVVQRMRREQLVLTNDDIRCARTRRIDRPLHADCTNSAHVNALEETSDVSGKILVARYADDVQRTQNFGLCSQFKE